MVGALLEAEHMAHVRDFVNAHRRQGGAAG
jgi:hypothetical protein